MYILLSLLIPFGITPFLLYYSFKEFVFLKTRFFYLTSLYEKIII